MRHHSHLLGNLSNRPFATSNHVVQNPPCWRASSLLFPHWDIKTKRPEPVKLGGFCTTGSLAAKGLLLLKLPSKYKDHCFTIAIIIISESFRINFDAAHN